MYKFMKLMQENLHYLRYKGSGTITKIVTSIDNQGRFEGFSVGLGWIFELLELLYSIRIVLLFKLFELKTIPIN